MFGELGGVAVDVSPVDAVGDGGRAGRSGPEVVVAGAAVVVEVELGDAGLEEFEGGVDGGAGGLPVGEVGVAEVEADADGVEVADPEDLEEVLGGGDVVGEVFEEQLDAERGGEGLEVFDRGEGVFEGARAPGIVLHAEVEDDGAEGDLLGGLDGALGLVHGQNALGLFAVDEVEAGGDVAAPVGVGSEEGLVEGGKDAGVAEPGGDVADGGAIGVVEVVAGGEDLDDGGAGAVHGVKETGVESLGEEDVGGEAGLHRSSRYRMGLRIGPGLRWCRLLASARCL